MKTVKKEDAGPAANDSMRQPVDLYVNRLDKTTRILLPLFALFPIAASVVQMFTYGLSLTNISSVGDVVLIYVFSLVDANKKVDRANKSGLDCVARFKRDGNTVVVKTENCGIEITAVTEIKVSVPEIYVSLTGDQCALTGIRVKRRQ